MSTLSAAQLADLVEKAKLILGIEDDDSTYHADAIAVYHDESSSATAATVEVTGAAVVLVITGGANAGTDTITFSAEATLTEMVAAINALSKGWVATLLGRDSTASATMVRKAATSAFGQSAELTLVYENQELLELLITNTLKGIETGLQRGLLSTAYTGEQYQWSGSGIIVLNQPDLISIDFIGAELADGLTVKYTGSDTNARVQATSTAVVTTSVAGGTTTTTTTAFADQATTTAMATTINALSGWTASVVNNFPSSLLRRIGTTKAKDREVTLDVWEDSDQGYYHDFQDGSIQFTEGYWKGCGGGEMRIDYTAGFAELPADVEQALLEAVKMASDAVAVTGGLKSEKLGDYSYTMADAGSAASAAQSAGAEAAMKLTAYMRLRV